MLHRNRAWFFSDHLGPDPGKKFGALRQFATLSDMMMAVARRLESKVTVAIFP
jgi:hypothetical protein